MAANSPDIFNDFLDALEVRHTEAYSLSRFENMSFNSLFGFSKLLDSYGIDSKGLHLNDKSELQAITAPFLALVDGAWVIVLKTTPSEVIYKSEGEVFTASFDTFCKGWCGTVFLAFPRPDACEPDYQTHHFLEVAEKVKTYLLAGGVVALFTYLFISAGLYRSVATILLTLFYLAGTFVSYLLVLKSLNIHSRAADSVCGVIEKEGCNTVLSTDASKFFGLFGWSEVGLTYFSVSLLCLLIFPQFIPWLGAINLCCLPFSFWSVWYQKFRAKAWCTLCLTVQTLLWACFFCYLSTGCLESVFPLRIKFFVLAVTYGVVLLAINKLLPNFDKTEKK